jgi:hypothetical protein
VPETEYLLPAGRSDQLVRHVNLVLRFTRSSRLLNRTSPCRKHSIPGIVERAVASGHRVTLFNRGKTNPQLFPELEKLGDREDVSGGGLSALAGNKRWNAVIDVWPAEPEVVMPTARLLKDRTDFYSFVSSIGAYTKLTKSNADENQPLRLMDQGYGGNAFLARLH